MIERWELKNNVECWFYLDVRHGDEFIELSLHENVPFYPRPDDVFCYDSLAQGLVVKSSGYDLGNVCVAVFLYAAERKHDTWEEELEWWERYGWEIQDCNEEFPQRDKKEETAK